MVLNFAREKREEKCLLKFRPVGKFLVNSSRGYELIRSNIFHSGLTKMNSLGAFQLQWNFKARKSDALRDDHSTIDKNLTDKCDI